MVTEPASESEAAAIVAALEQFLAETAPAGAAARAAAQSPWQRAALDEAIVGSRIRRACDAASAATAPSAPAG